MKGNNQNRPVIPTSGKILIGIFMILFYIAVGILFILNIFDTIDHTVSIIVGALLCAYGVFRAYRLYIGTRQ